MPLTTRAPRDEDLPLLVDLFNRAHAGYAGFAERSVDDFEWRYLSRPDIGSEGVIVVEDSEQRLLGYAVAGASGTISEYAIEPNADRRRVAAALVAEAERLAGGHGVDEITLHVPGDDLDMAAVLRQGGYSDRRPIQQYLSLIDLPGVVQKVLAAHRDALPDSLGTVLFVIRNPRAWHPERFSVQVGGTGGVSLHSVKITLTVEDLVGLMAGAMNPWRGIATGRTRISPRSRLAIGVRVLRALRLRKPFFFTLGDVI